MDSNGWKFYLFFFRPTPLGFRQVVQHVRLHVAEMSELINWRKDGRLLIEWPQSKLVVDRYIDGWKFYLVFHWFWSWGLQAADLNRLISAEEPKWRRPPAKTTFIEVCFQFFPGHCFSVQSISGKLLYLKARLPASSDDDNVCERRAHATAA